MPPLSVLVKPASSACNMNCEYCFYKDVSSNRKDSFTSIMSVDTAEQLIASALEYADESCTFLFQGGEPTLAGLDFFRAIIELESKHAKDGVKISNAIQTNGYLIDEIWAQFLASNGFLVGLSLDGPAEIHNSYRKDCLGKETFNRAMNAARLLDKYGAEYNVLSVVTGRSAKHIEKIYNFFKRQGFRWLQFIPCLEPLGHDRGQAGFHLGSAEYERFLIRIFDLWYRDLMNGDFISIRHIDNWLQMLLGIPPEACSMKGYCSVQFVVEGDGRIYPCDFYVLDALCLGKVGDTSFKYASDCAVAKNFISASCSIPEQCRKCVIYPLCRNGCRRDRVLTPDGTPGTNYYCSAYRSFFSKRKVQLMHAAQLICGK